MKHGPVRLRAGCDIHKQAGIRDRRVVRNGKLVSYYRGPDPGIANAKKENQFRLA